MSKIVASAAIRGAKAITKEAEDFLSKGIQEKECRYKNRLPGDGIFLPMANALLGQR